MDDFSSIFPEKQKLINSYDVVHENKVTLLYYIIDGILNENNKKFNLNSISQIFDEFIKASDYTYPDAKYNHLKINYDNSMFNLSDKFSG